MPRTVVVRYNLHEGIGVGCAAVDTSITPRSKHRAQDGKQSTSHHDLPLIVHPSAVYDSIQRSKRGSLCHHLIQKSSHRGPLYLTSKPRALHSDAAPNSNTPCLLQLLQQAQRFMCAVLGAMTSPASLSDLPKKDSTLIRGGLRKGLRVVVTVRAQATREIAPRTGLRRREGGGKLERRRIHSRLNTMRCWVSL